MSEDRGTLEALADELTILLSPLTSLTPANAPVFLAQLGIVITDAQAASIAGTLTALTNSTAGLINLDTELNASIDIGNSGVVVSQRIAALNQVAQVISAFGQLKTALAGLGIVGAAPVIADLPRRLFDLLLTRYVGRGRTALPLLEFGGILERTDHNVGLFDPDKAFFTTNEFHLERIGGWLSNPTVQLANFYQWNQPGFDGKNLLLVLERLAVEFGLPALYDPSLPNSALDLVFLEIGPRLDLHPRGLAVRLNHGLSKGTVEFGTRRWTCTIALDTNVPADTSLLLQPGAITIQWPDAVKLTSKVTAAYSASFGASDPLVLLSFLGLARVTVDEVGASADLRLNQDGSADLALSADLRGGKVRIGTGDADGFIEKILSGFPLEADFDLGLTYSITDGLRFRGSGALEVQLAQHVALGPVEVNNLTLSLGIKDDAFPIAIKTDLKTSLGPLTALVQRIGFEVAIRLTADNTGNLGPVDLDVDFLAPTGVGLSMDAGGFKGGGFLFVDAEKGEYAGGLELDFLGIVSVKAVGLLNTKFPDGHRGFALVIIISAEFPPIQLGFGFTLLGVGGLIGLSRTVDTEAMRETMHQGSLDSVLFPRDIVANAPRIVNDLRLLFPAAERHFLIGPMVKFGWGTPTILSLEFGLILDIPVPAFVMLGRLRVGLPFQDLPLFDIHVTFVGGVDFEKGELWFDATLHGSRLLSFALTGDMAVRLSWGEHANFILTVGGFHPAYTPPLGMGAFQRLGITIFDGNPRLRAETYFAITSNTVQFGAKAELFFGIDLFNVYGFIAFDVLIQFDPFHFVASLSAMLAVRSGSATLMGIRIDAMVEGPQPWHAKGTGHFEISLIISISFDVDFEVTLGDDLHDTLPAIAVLPKLVEAFTEPNNWRAVTPTGSNVQVTLRQFEVPPGVVILHPFGSLEIVEKLVPLNLPVQRLGTGRIGDGRVFAVEHVLLGTTPGQIQPVREQFAPAQFIEMSDAEKISRPSFERYEAGVQVGGGDAVNATQVKHLELVYEVIYIPERRKPIFLWLADTLFNVFAGSGAVSQSPLSAAQTGPSVLGPGKAAMAPEQFAVASTTDLTLFGERMLFESEMEARAAMHAAIDRDPALTSTLQVIPSSLVKAA